MLLNKSECSFDSTYTCLGLQFILLHPDEEWTWRTDLLPVTHNYHIVICLVTHGLVERPDRQCTRCVVSSVDPAPPPATIVEWGIQTGGYNTYIRTYVGLHTYMHTIYGYHYIVLSGASFCREESQSGILWPQTAGGNSSQTPCSGEAVGKT